MNSTPKIGPEMDLSLLTEVVGELDPHEHSGRQISDEHTGEPEGKHHDSVVLRGHRVVAVI